MKKNKILNIPKFASEDDERKFWDTHDTTDYFDMEHPLEMDLSALKPSTRPITIRLPVSIICQNYPRRSYQSRVRLNSANSPNIC